MMRLLIAVVLLEGLTGCIVAPPPAYGYAPGYYYPGYYYGPSVSIGIVGGCCRHGGWRGR
ncbi:hypothetical protein FAZ69_26180 [Trinickia terrae]|uniref:DUF3300 domain-containing protein n=1 Tax=Trinickia terrae TaxID=2571161 RepID=A0A4U1HP73_9BURK|nr:hypothetical protein [Trinickia terrae]TKC83175.1 hypothetical protein FAZ69_26180 [Trinickia terrae]